MASTKSAELQPAMFTTSRHLNWTERHSSISLCLVERRRLKLLMDPTWLNQDPWTLLLISLGRASAHFLIPALRFSSDTEDIFVLFVFQCLNLVLWCWGPSSRSSHVQGKHSTWATASGQVLKVFFVSSQHSVLLSFKLSPAEFL